MNLDNDNDNDKPEISEPESEDSFEELINMHQRQRYKVNPAPKTMSKVKVFVSLKEHREIFEFMPEEKSKVRDLIHFLYEKNQKWLQEKYSEALLKVLICDVHGKKEDFPGKPDLALDVEGNIAMIGSDYFLLTSKDGDWANSSLLSDSMYKNTDESGKYAKNQKITGSYCCW